MISGPITLFLSLFMTADDRFGGDRPCPGIRCRTVCAVLLFCRLRRSVAQHRTGFEGPGASNETVDRLLKRGE